MRVRATAALLAGSIAFQFGMVLALAETDGFADMLIVVALTIIVTASVALGILLERCGLA